MKHARTAVLVGVKIAITAFLVWYGVRRLDTRAALTLVRSLPLLYAAAAVALLVVQQLFGAMRLRRLVELAGVRITLRAAVGATFIGLFFGTTAVSFISGDVMRVWRLARSRVSISDGFQAVLFDRMFGFMALMGMIGVAWPFLLRITSDRPLLYGVLAAVVLTVTGTAVFLMIHRLPATLRRWRVIAFAATLSRQALSIASRPGQVLVLIAVSVLLQVLNVLTIYTLATGLRVETRLSDLLVVVPPVMLVTMLPVSFAGWGVRESAMLVVLGLLGVGAEQSVAVSIGFGLSMMATGLPGGVLWFLTRRSEPLPAYVDQRSSDADRVRLQRPRPVAPEAHG